MLSSCWGESEKSAVSEPEASAEQSRSRMMTTMLYTHAHSKAWNVTIVERGSVLIVG
jgi:hypothetical protein